jgi:hypothetical protein
LPSQKGAKIDKSIRESKPFFGKKRKPPQADAQDGFSQRAVYATLFRFIKRIV